MTEKPDNVIKLVTEEPDVPNVERIIRIREQLAVIEKQIGRRPCPPDLDREYKSSEMLDRIYFWLEMLRREIT